MTTAIQGSFIKDEQEKISLINEVGYINSFQDTDFEKILKNEKITINAWLRVVDEKFHLMYAHSFIYETINVYWQSTHTNSDIERRLPQCNIELTSLDEDIIAVANAIGNSAAKVDVITAAFQLGNLYTSILPKGMRSTNGVFYTPPSLTRRLINMSSKAGVDWKTASVADPACGGGAFLAPVALEMLKALKNEKPITILEHIESHLKGYEIDPFGAWLTQVFLEVSLKDTIIKAGRTIDNLISICNTLEIDFSSEDSRYDLIIGNPPYGKLKLTDEIRTNFKDSLYGHANLYGLFTHLAIKMAKKGGIIGYLTPTSFLSGEYFKNLRSYIRDNAKPLEIDFVSIRKGVFEDVLQETLLTTYKKTNEIDVDLTVNEIVVLPNGNFQIHNNGNSSLPLDISAPWILPRKPEQTSMVKVMEKMPSFLRDWGYKISTGQLVWNRYKDQLTEEYQKGYFPIIWSEAVTQDGNFIHRSEKKNHAKWFSFKTTDGYLLTTTSCILLQRTTAKEQAKRLIAAVLPQSFINKQKAVIIENHLNMIVSISEVPAVSLELLSVFLNSKAVNDAFRTISGSVAVSAYELESLPLPSIDQLDTLKLLVQQGTNQELIELECLKLYTEK